MSQVAHSPRTQGQERRRAHLLQAARVVFSKQGYPSTVVDDIAAQAGVAKGTVYLYFPSKEAIYHCALLEHAHTLASETKRLVSAAPTWKSKIRAFFETGMEQAVSDRDFMRLLLGEYRSPCPATKSLKDALNHLVQDAEAQLARVFAVAVATGEMRDIDPELAAWTVSDMTHGLMERRLFGWARSNGNADVEFALELVCRSLSLPG